MLTDPILLVDTWQFGGKIDEAVLFANGVSGIFIRINQNDGSLIPDANFALQWEEAKSLPVRIPYFVLSPKYDAQTIYDWLDAVVPYTARALALDVEIKYIGISSSEYANRVNAVLEKIKTRWNILIYTGQGFLDLLSSWPMDYPYWWAQYPNEFWPTNEIQMTWETLKAKLAKYDRPYNADKIPGELKCWQFTGDKLILPGCEKAMDVNVWFGTMDELLVFAGENDTNPPPIPIQDKLIDEQKWFEGMIYQKYQVRTDHGMIQCHLCIYDMNNVQEIFVSPRPASRKYVPDYLETYDLDTAINGDQFISITPGGYNACHGIPYGLENQNNEAVIFIDKSNNLIMQKPPIKSPADLWNAYAFPNLLIENGAVLKHIYDINALKGKRPRTASGWSQDKKRFYTFLADGDETYNAATESGFTFVETAEFLLRHGAYMAFMHDGGGSTTGARRNPNGGNAIIYNEPRGEDLVIKYNQSMRRVVNVVGIKMKTQINPNPNDGGNNTPPDNPPPTGDNMNYRIAIPVKPRKTPSMYETVTKSNLPTGYEFTSTVTFTWSPNPPISGQTGDVTFVQLPDGYWIPIIYKGDQYVIETGTGTETPPPVYTFPDYLYVELPNGLRQRYIKE